MDMESTAVRQERFRAMGTDAHVIVAAPDAVAATLVGLARQRVELLEQCWSRFRPTSELSGLNARAGSGPIPVSEDLLILVQRMHDAWVLSDGLFDPTVLTSMNRLGYDTDFTTVSARPFGPADVAVVPSPGMTSIVIDPLASTVSLPTGIGIDPGAIGKGLAADLIADELHSIGAQGVLVNLGGDIAIRGTLAEQWTIGIEDERRSLEEQERTIDVLVLPDGAKSIGVATSTTLKRRWAQGRRHHVIDPRTGDMATSDLVQVTVAAQQAWHAEVIATTALLKPSHEALAWLEDLRLPALLLTASDEHRTSVFDVMTGGTPHRPHDQHSEEHHSDNRHPRELLEAHHG